MVPPMKQFEHLKIQLEVIKSATNNFTDENCIGRGGFGKVYKGEIDNTMVALKRLNREFGQGDPEFWKEIMMLSVYKHENIVSLLGYCDDCGEKILMYEYLPMKSLDRYLKSSELTWVRRLKICIGAAHGLAFLHNPEGTQQRVLHRDIKSSNILLDENWNAKISDFGLSKFGPANQKNTFLISHPVGTHGYCDPLYVETGLLTKESDIYSFGVVLCEVLCGRLCMVDDKLQPLVGLIRQSFRQNTVNQIVLTNIRDEINPNSLDVFSKVAYQCLKLERDEHPSIAEILRGLEAALQCQVSESSTPFSFSSPSPSDSASYSSIKSSQPCRRFQFHEIQLATKNFDETLVVGIGSFGKVYKGEIFYGSRLVVAAIKRFSSSSASQGASEFWNEVEILSTFRHSNIVSLIGYCNQDEIILVYEYIPDGSLYYHLHSLDTPLSWRQQLNICIDVGRGLHYLHTGVEVGVIHCDIKTANVFLDESWTAKIADLGLAKIVPRNQTYVMTGGACGTTGYLDPGYFRTKMVTRKSDVYSFGVVLFEVLCRKRPLDTSFEYIKKGKLKQIPDSDIRDQIAPRCLKEFVRTAEACLRKDPDQRPTMAEVLVSLLSVLTLQEKFDSSSQPTRRTIFHRIFGGKVSEPSTSLPSPSDSSFYSSIKKSQPLRPFQFHEIQLATKSFDETLIVGRGSYATVYKGNVFDGSSLVVAAIKRLDSRSLDEGATEFWTEVETLSTFRHSNIVSLIGYCNQGEEMILVYEYIPNGSLHDHLHILGTPLSWLQRLSICIDAGRGLHYLHTRVELGVIHRDIKSSHILLYESWGAKIADLGLAKIVPRNQTSVETLVKGTFGYLDPDYFHTNMVTRKSDVYSFGVVLFEVLCWKKAIDFDRDLEQRSLATRAIESIKKGKLEQILDSDIRDQIAPQCLKEFVRTAEACLHRDPEQRPTMAEVLVSLESVLTLQEKFDSSLQ